MPRGKHGLGVRLGLHILEIVKEVKAWEQEDQGFFASVNWRCVE